MTINVSQAPKTGTERVERQSPTDFIKDPHAKLIPLHLHPMGFIEAFTHLGADLNALLRDTGINPAMLEAKDVKISYTQQKILTRNGIQLCREPGLGLLVGQRFDWSYHGAVGSVVHCSPSLREAAEAFQRYSMIPQPIYAFYPCQPNTYVDEKGLLIHQVQCLPIYDESEEDLRRFELEFRLALTVRIWDMCGNKSVADPSVRVCVEFPEPAHAHLYRALPCTSVQFGGEQTHVATHYKYVIEPFRSLRKHAFEELIAKCEEDLRNANLEPSYAAKVRWHIYTHFNRQVTLEQIAGIMNMTPRTLTRRLAAENTSFRNILHEVRMELTAYHLRSSKLSTDEIAELMGFSSASSLRRAIRNWAGTPVSAVRSLAPARPAMAGIAGIAALVLTEFCGG